MVMHTVFSHSHCSRGQFYHLPACLTSISSGQSGPQQDKHMSIGWPGSTTFSSKVLKCILNHRNRNCQDSYLSSVEVGWRRLMSAALWHSSASWCGINSVTGPLLSSPSSLSSSVFSPHKGALCCALIRSSSYLEAGSEQKECSSCPHSPQLGFSET